MLTDAGDERGHSFSLPAALGPLLARMEDAHLATIVPGAIRGNHYHLHRDELIFVMARDRWACHWDEGENTDRHTRRFDAGCVAVEVTRGWSHAIENEGTVDLVLLSLTTPAYDPNEPDAHRRVVSPPATG